MKSAAELAVATERALEYAQRQPGVSEAEVFTSANGALLARLNYTSHIPCNGVEEPKSTESCGIGIRAVFDAPDGPRVGFGSEPSDLTAAGAERALARARRAAVADPDFVSLPRPSREPRALAGYHDPRLMEVDDASPVEPGPKGGHGAPRPATSPGQPRARPDRHPRERRRAGIVGRVPGDLRPPARRRPPEQHRRPGLHRGRLLPLEHPVPRQARPARRIAAAQRL